MKLSLFRNSASNTTSTETIDSWDDFVDLVTIPIQGQKNGDYFVRGFCDGSRGDQNMRGLDLIIIDGDQTMDNGGSCEPLLPVHNAIKLLNIKHVIYTSYSNSIVNNRNKWRLCIPCDDVVDASTLNQGVAEIITILHGSGLKVRNVKENGALSQAWYTPRYPVDGSVDDFDFRYHDGQTYSLTGTIAESAHYNSTVDGAIKDNGGIFSWETVFAQFKAGTLHQGLKSACGWLIFTSDWRDSQIKQYLIAMAKATCPDAEKVKRACETKEIDGLIKYCREKSGTGVEILEDWKNHLITADQLKDKEFPPIKWAVQDIIPEGLCMLAGDPKVGKSLLAVDICGAIASGNRAFGTQPCVEGTSIYMSFEDPPRRIKGRIKEQSDLWPETFKIIDRGVPPLGPQFFKVVDEMILLWPDIRAIVIDTLQFVVPPKKPGTNDYDHYYSVLDPLHRWSLDNHVAIICITHKSKARTQEGDNPFSGIIGSVGIQSNADAMLLLSRNYAKKSKPDDISLADGFLDVSGREVPSEHYSLDFDQECIKWSLREEINGDDDGGTKQPNELIVMDVLRKASGPMYQKQVSESANINLSTVKSLFQRMLKAGKIIKIDKVGYQPTNHIYKQEEW